MDVLIYLVPFTVLFSLIGLVALIWAIRSKQYDDMKGAAERILFDTEDNNRNDSKDKNHKK
ncbi:cytochrome oxidase maturation protein, cbb3-type [endosymbiont of Acanthamoeba sp. UWC8]|uniref:cbb3-type cytochrome oxidase assembly protein CcoS n=1 Tax=endosymbiont of Acanthamoeba sp. UWC8 TaxID=86106 RepID=UPI0004D184C5|nr:cbb3-type cytochrome oxidase assembly protein CcoS [endosymbiont of Acanthamoeba sp. UWC8]AIF81140.1 cytochrome oxidase maturation protein, cbb3-type [endosymbiont of Acanthamoeba sp. UWC8]